MVRIERFVDQTLAAQTNPEQRQVLHRYTVWQLIRRLRQRNNGHAATIQQFNSVRQRTYAADRLPRLAHRTPAHPRHLSAKPTSIDGSPTTPRQIAARQGTSSDGPTRTS